MELPGVLKNAGCEVDVYCVAGSWAIQNTAHCRWVPANENESLFVRDLLTFVEENGAEYNWIIPGDDPLIRLLNEQITSEELFYKIMPLTNIENRELLGSKGGFSTLCKKYNINTPNHLLQKP